MTPELIAAAATLAETLTAENQALRALDFPAAARLLDRKTAALGAFAGPTSRATPPNPANRARLLALAEQLDGLMHENRTLLERAMLVQNRVIGTIARAAPRALAAEGRRYGRTGAATMGGSLRAIAVSARA